MERERWGGEIDAEKKKHRESYHNPQQEAHEPHRSPEKTVQINKHM